MSNKRIRLPKEGLVKPEERGGDTEFIDGTSDVQGHGWVNPAPPSEYGQRTPSQGGELRQPDDDDEGPARS